MVSIDRRSLRRTLASLAEYPLLLVSFTLYKVLSAAILLYPTSVPKSIPAFAGSLTSNAIIFFACAVCCVLFAAVGRNARIFDHPSYLWVALGLSALGTAVLLLVSPHVEGVLGIAAYLIGVLCAASGFCAVHIEFGRLLGYLGMTYTLVFNIGCALLSLPFIIAICGLERDVFVFIVLVAATLLVATLKQSIERMGRAKVYARSETKLSIPWRFMFTSLAQGLSIGLILAIATPSAELSILEDASATVVAAVLAFACALLMRIDFDRLVYRIGFALIGAAYVLYALAEASGSPVAAVIVLQYVAYSYLDIILWGLGSYLIKDCGQPAVWVAACPSASLLTGRIAGSVMGTALVSGPAGTPHAVILICAVAAYAFMFVALQLSSGENILNGWGFILPSDAGDQRTDLERACALIAADFRLTAREQDVLRLVVQKKSRREIADELFISQNTVKTHIRKLYAKLEVHSNEELIAFTEQQQRAFDTHD